MHIKFPIISYFFKKLTLDPIPLVYKLKTVPAKIPKSIPLGYWQETLETPGQIILLLF